MHKRKHQDRVLRSQRWLPPSFPPIVRKVWQEIVGLFSFKPTFFHLKNKIWWGRINIDPERPHHGCFWHQYFTNNILHSFSLRIETFTIFTIRVSCFSNFRTKKTQHSNKNLGWRGPPLFRKWESHNLFSRERGERR